jgi:PAS domain S-box-containing protein
VLEPGERRSARLLAGLLLCLAGVGVTSATAQLALREDFGPTYLAVMGAVVVLLAGYRLARSTRFRLAAVFASLVPVATGAAVGLLRPEDPAWFAFMTLGMVLAAAFLRVRHLAAVVLVTVVVGAVVVGVAAPRIEASRATAMFSFIMAMGGVVFLTARHLHQVEADREGSLRDSMERYRRLFDNAPVGIGVSTAKGEFIEANERLLQIVGHPPGGEGAPRDVATLYADPEDRPRLLQRLRDEGRVVREAVTLRRPDGQVVDAEMSLVPLALHDGPEILAMVEDVGPRRRAEREREYLAEMLERSVNEVYIFDASTLRFEFANESARHNLGYSLAQLQEMTPVDLKPEFTVDTFRQLLAPVLRGDVPLLAFETTHQRADGSTYPVEVRLQSATSRGRTVVQAMIIDITERRRLQAELLQAQKLESVGRLAGGIAHDFNNLLTVIKANVELARGEDGAGHPASEELTAASRAADSAATLTRQLLAFSRRQVVVPQPLDLNASVAGIERLVRRVLSGNITLVTHPAPDLGQVRADPSQIEQILMNLTVNARDAIRDHGTITITTGNARGGDRGPDGRPLPPGDWVFVAVADSGVGMTTTTLDHIFEPFFTTKRPGAGTGLGLASVEGAVSQNGGRITVNSSPGRGSTFTVFLPRVSAGHVAIPAQHSDAPTPTGGETILVVDDDADVRKLAERVLRRLGYRAVTAPGGEAALALAQNHPEHIDLVVTDVVMPGMNGLQLRDALSASHPGMRVLLTSGYSAEIIAGQGVLDPGVDFLPKPYTMKELGRQVRQALDRAPTAAGN